VSRWFQDYGLDRVDGRLLVGAVPRDGDDVRVLAELGVSRVVCLVADAEYGPGERDAVAAAYAAPGIDEARVPSEDFGGLSPATLEASSGAAEAALASGATVYLHCRAGWQRSVVTAAATLARTTDDPPEATLGRVVEARRGACPLPHQVDDLSAWWAGRAG
jgi:protein-tyrosine phosphatase